VIGTVATVVLCLLLLGVVFVRKRRTGQYQSAAEQRDCHTVITNPTYDGRSVIDGVNDGGRGASKSSVSVIGSNAVVYAVPLATDSAGAAGSTAAAPVYSTASANDGGVVYDGPNLSAQMMLSVPANAYTTPGMLGYLAPEYGTSNYSVPSALHGAHTGGRAAKGTGAATTPAEYTTPNELNRFGGNFYMTPTTGVGSSSVAVIRSGDGVAYAVPMAAPDAGDAAYYSAIGEPGSRTATEVAASSHPEVSYNLFRGGKSAAAAAAAAPEYDVAAAVEYDVATESGVGANGATQQLSPRYRDRGGGSGSAASTPTYDVAATVDYDIATLPSAKMDTYDEPLAANTTLPVVGISLYNEPLAVAASAVTYSAASSGPAYHVDVQTSVGPGSSRSAPVYDVAATIEYDVAGGSGPRSGARTYDEPLEAAVGGVLPTSSI
jgi:hypothetical protein